MPTVTPKPVKTSDKAEDMLRFDLDNENETVRNYRDRVRQCEALGEFALAEQIRQILVQEQEHQIDLATALGIDVPDVSKPECEYRLGPIASADHGRAGLGLMLPMKRLRSKRLRPAIRAGISRMRKWGRSGRSSGAAGARRCTRAFRRWYGPPGSRCGHGRGRRP